MYTLESVKASDRAYEELRRDIVSGARTPGSALPEVELGDALGISRTPVREAIARLVADGLAVQASGRTVVSAVSEDAVDQLFAVRQALEVLAAREAAASGITAPFAELARRFEAAVPAAGGDPESYYPLTAQLDLALDAAVANPYLTTSLRQLRLHLQRLRRISSDDPARLAASAAEHAAIAQAIAEQDPEVAAAATVIHLRHAHAAIKDHVRRPQARTQHEPRLESAGTKESRA